MKYIKSLVFFILITSVGFAKNQTNPDKTVILQKIDTLQSKINKNNKIIDSAIFTNKKLKSEIKEYYSQLEKLSSIKTIGSEYYCTKMTNIYETTKGYKILCGIKEGDKINVVETLKTHYKVFYKDIYGYVSKNSIKKKNIPVQKNKDEVENGRIEHELVEVNRRNSIIKKYGKINGEKVLKNLIWIGMTSKMAIDS